MKGSFRKYYSRTELSVREDEQKHSNREMTPNNSPRVPYCKNAYYLANSELKRKYDLYTKTVCSNADVGTSDRIAIFRFSDSYQTKKNSQNIGLAKLSD
jgi:hypothetical protein